MVLSILNELKGSTEFILASSLLSKDGVPMATVPFEHLPRALDEDRIGGLSAALMCCGRSAMADWIGGDLDLLVIQGASGSVLMTFVDPELILTALVAPSTDADRILPNLMRAAERIRALTAAHGHHRAFAPPAASESSRRAGATSG